MICPGGANENTSGSMATRIRPFASKLIARPFSRPGPPSTVSSLADFFGEGSKGGSVSASTNPSELRSSSLLQYSQHSSVHFDHQRGPEGPMERETSQLWKICGDNASCQSSFERFTSREAPRPQLQQEIYTSSESQIQTSYHDSNQSWVRDGEPCHAASPQLPSVRFSDTIRTAADIYPDGAVVVSILCDHEFSPDGDIEHLVRPTEDSKVLHDDMPKVCQLVDLLEPTFASSTAKFVSNVGNEQFSTSTGGVSQETIWMEPIESCDPMTADDKLFSWLKNFKSYQDDVWGNMSYPARKSRVGKAAQKNDPKTAGKTGAVKRLAMIVRHINHTIIRK